MNNLKCWLLKQYIRDDGVDGLDAELVASTGHVDITHFSCLTATEENIIDYQISFYRESTFEMVVV